VVAREMRARQWHQGGESSQKVEGFEHNLRGTVAIRPAPFTAMSAWSENAGARAWWSSCRGSSHGTDGNWPRDEIFAEHSGVF
jgi:hypothetical protein